MTYTNLSLQWVSICVGILMIATHLPGLFFPKPVLEWIKKMPRNYPLGVVLTAAAGIWFTVLTATMDLGEVSPYRNALCAVWVAGTVALIIFVPSFLAVRALGMLLLLGTGVMLDAAFLSDNPAKFVITVLAYIWAVGGIVYVASPYIMRDLIDKMFALQKWYQAHNVFAIVFGIVLICLGIFVY